MSQTQEGNALATKTTGINILALNMEDGVDIGMEMDGLTMSFPRVKIPSAGGIAFEVPGDDPQSPDMEKELVGIIVDHYPTNSYWADKTKINGARPDCYAGDGKIGVGNPGGTCATCPHNQFVKGGGKACKNQHRIFLLLPDQIFPMTLNLPPMSLKPFSEYVTQRIIGRGKKLTSVLTKITLKKTENGDGTPYSQAQFGISDVLIPEQAQQMAAYAQGIRAITRKLPSESEMEENTTSGIGSTCDDDEFPFG